MWYYGTSDLLCGRDKTHDSARDGTKIASPAFLSLLPQLKMHYLRSKSSIHRFRLAAFLWYVGCLFLPIGGGALIYSLTMIDHELTCISMVLIIVAGLIFFAQWIVAERTNCPLCIVPVLRNRSCVKNRHARKLFGSHRTRVASEILFSNSFHCPYCDETTALKLRSMNRNRTSPRG